MRTGLVLGGGAARGAYEAGVIAYLRDELARELDDQVRLEVIAGTSVGAINACYLAATEQDPVAQGRGIVEAWTSLELANVLSFGVRDVVRVLRESWGKQPIRWGRGRHGGLVDPRGLEAIVGRAIPWTGIGRNLRRGVIQGLAVTATQVSSGRSTVFLQTSEGVPQGWGTDPGLVVAPTRIGPRHALASAAIPVLFPAVVLPDGIYVDGGLGLNVPLSPALRLGAERVIVISLRSEESRVARPTPLEELERKAASAPFLAGKALDALLVDRTEEDLARLRRINELLEAGTRAYGDGFGARLNASLPPGQAPLRYVRNLLIRPSRDIARLAAEYARSDEFRRRSGGLAGSLVRRLAENESADEADLASYLLFDGRFAAMLVELGRADARARRDAWLRFFSPAPTSIAEAAEPSAATG